MSDDNLKRLAVAEVNVLSKYYVLKKKGEENMIYSGERSENVKVLQRLLMEAGFDLEPYNDDGIFGPKTSGAWRAFATEVDIPVSDPIAVGFSDFEQLALYIADNAKDECSDQINALETEVDGLKAQVSENLMVINKARQLRDWFQSM